MGARDAALVLVITGLAHTALHVADVDAAVMWYRDVLGLVVLSPPYRIEGESISRDMGELLPKPVVVKAAIVGVDDGTDRVIEVIEYPSVTTGPPPPPDVTRLGFTHVGLLCDDVVASRVLTEPLGQHAACLGPVAEPIAELVELAHPHTLAHTRRTAAHPGGPSD